MSFIRVTKRDTGKTKTDLNVNHIIGYTPGEGDVGSDVLLSNGDGLMVNESPRSLRSFIRKAQGTLPAPATAVAEPTGD